MTTRHQSPLHPSPSATPVLDSVHPGHLGPAQSLDSAGPLPPLLYDWTQWLRLSTTPPSSAPATAHELLHVRGGVIIDPDRWPPQAVPRLYAAYDDHGPVYVGQTTNPLTTRIRNHFGNQRSPEQRLKAGSWSYVVSAAFAELDRYDLDRLERSAADWLLPLRTRVGRRHPRTQSDVSNR